MAGFIGDEQIGNGYNGVSYHIHQNMKLHLKCYIYRKWKIFEDLLPDTSISIQFLTFLWTSFFRSAGVVTVWTRGSEIPSTVVPQHHLNTFISSSFWTLFCHNIWKAFINVFSGAEVTCSLASNCLEYWVFFVFARVTVLT